MTIAWHDTTIPHRKKMTELLHKAQNQYKSTHDINPEEFNEPYVDLMSLIEDIMLECYEMGMNRKNE